MKSHDLYFKKPHLKKSYTRKNSLNNTNSKQSARPFIDTRYHINACGTTSGRSIIHFILYEYSSIIPVAADILSLQSTIYQNFVSNKIISRGSKIYVKEIKKIKKIPVFKCMLYAKHYAYWSCGY